MAGNKEKILFYVQVENLVIKQLYCTGVRLYGVKDFLEKTWVSVWGLTSHSTHYRSFRGRFYRPDGQTNSDKALKETSWSSRSGLNPTTTPPCYSNTTLGNRLYAQCKGPNVTNPICWACKNCSYKWVYAVKLYEWMNEVCCGLWTFYVTQSNTELFW